jgi:chromosome segregation ATPase
VTTIRLINTADNPAPDECGAARIGTGEPHLPAIEDGPILMRATRPAPATEARRAIPGFDSEDDLAFGNADLLRQVEDAAEAAVRPWPDIRPGRQERADASEGVTENPWRELSARRAEIAALQKIQEKQNDALRRAREEILGLDDTVKLLRAQLKQQDRETAAAGRTLQQADEQKAALRAELDQTKANFAELLQQTAELNTAFDAREKEIAAVRGTVTSLKAQLAAKAGTTDLTAAITEAKTRYYNDFEKRYARFEAETEKLAHQVGARGERIRSLEAENAALHRRCEALAAKAAGLEAGKRDAEEKLVAQTAMVTFLDSTLQAERESTGKKIAELATALQRERLERADEARESALVCKEIVQLLPRLARPSGRVMDAMAREAGVAAGADGPP